MKTKLLAQMNDIRCWLRLRFFSERMEDNKSMLIVGDYQDGTEYKYYSKKFPNAKIDSINLYRNKYVNIVCDIQKFQTEKKYDYIIMSAIIEHLENDFQTLRNIRNMLTPYGLVFIHVPFYNEIEGTHIQLYSPHMFTKTLLICGLEPIDSMEVGAFFSIGYYFLKRQFHWANEWIYRNYKSFRFLNKNKERGGYYICKKSKSINSVKLNKNRFKCPHATA